MGLSISLPGRLAALGAPAFRTFSAPTYLAMIWAATVDGAAHWPMYPLPILGEKPESWLKTRALKAGVAHFDRE